MNVEQLLDSLPEYAKDLRLNWTSLVSQGELTDSQKWGSLVTAAFVSRNPQLMQAVEAEAAKLISPETINAAKGAAAIMGMNNIYYRFHHLSANEKYATMPSRLRMNIIRNHGADQTDFELWSVVASAINGCDKCVRSHERVLAEKGVSDETILQAVRLASVVHAVAAVLDSQVAVLAAAQ